LGKVLESTLPLVVDISGAAGAEVHLMEDDGCLAWAASHGLGERFVAASRSLRLRPGEDILGQAFATKAPVLVEDLGREPRFLRHEAALASGYIAVLCTPLIAQGTPVGTLQLYASAERQYSAELLPPVQAVSEHSRWPSPTPTC